MDCTHKTDYLDFLSRKSPKAISVGLDHVPQLADHLFPFQRDVTEFALRRGRCGMYLSTGLGKTAVALEYSKHAAAATNGRALILTPLAVAAQFAREGRRWGYDCRVIKDASQVADGINICNYDRLDKLDPDTFGSVVLDEASVLKSFGGVTQRAITAAFSGHRFRMAATATPAPNDHMELGTQSAFLGILDYREMLSRWFINDTSSASQKWRLKGHAHRDFYNWMASWSRMATLPSDLGYEDDGYILDPYVVIKHKAHAATVSARKGELFSNDASATTMFDVKRQTSAARADVIASLVNAESDQPWLVWCDTNDEADALMARIPDAIEVRGSHSSDVKEERLLSFVDGKSRVLITKASVAGWGLNFQHCARMAFVGRTFSYESYFQAVRRCWRFGQTRKVHVHLVVAQGEDQISRVLDRKASEHDEMRSAMADAMRRNTTKSSSRMVAYGARHIAELPAWLTNGK